MTTRTFPGGSAGDKVPALDLNMGLAPIGAVLPFAGTSAPNLWLLCNGAAVSRTTYDELFSLIGTTYGAGDGSTTFNLPNLKGKIPVGLDASQTEFDTIGETGGEKTHQLTVPELPAHTHTVPRLDSFATNGGSSNNTSQSGTQNSGSTGSDQAHNNLQPYIVLNYIIRY